MLEMRPDCEMCGCDLPADQPGALICSFECTFCGDHGLTACPNCGGDLVKRPMRSGTMLENYPASVERKFKA